jgi:diacylglycerol kinase family enzyme
MQIGVITNPNSRKNRGRPNRTQRLQQIVGQFGEVHQTPSPDDVKPVAREFLRQNTTFWVSDGGDGALHWMLRTAMAVLEEEEFAGKSVPLPMAIPTNGGTIDFVAKNVGIRGDAESILTTLRDTLAKERPLEVVEVDSMLVSGIQRVNGSEVPFKALGFASAAGGVGQRFFAKYYDKADPSAKDIVRVVATATASLPFSHTPLGYLPLVPNYLKRYGKEVFAPTHARVTVDGRELETTRCTGIHIASMSINLGNVLKFFGAADEPGKLGCIVGDPPPWMIIANIPRMYRGQSMVGANLYDGPCDEMTMEAVGDELLAPVIDGEYYRNVVKVTFRIGPRVRIPRIRGAKS